MVECCGLVGFLGVIISSDLIIFVIVGECSLKYL